MKKHIENLAIKDLRENEKQAYFNEFKGVLFEFLVAQSVAKMGQQEESFLKGISEEHLKKLMAYERSLRSSAPELLALLRSLAQKTAIPFIQSLTKEQLEGMENVTLMEGGDKLKEADFTVRLSGQELPVSLKLSKDKAFVNTKSAGIRSVVSTYFKDFQNASFWQEKINQEVHAAFLEMAYEFYEIAGLVLVTPFGEEWIKAGLPTLPGLLPKAYKGPLLRFYARSAAILHQAFLFFSQQNADLFAKSLLPLCGFGRVDLWQLSCFYSPGYQLKTISLNHGQDFIKKVKAFQFVDSGLKGGQFELLLPNYLLQIRVKPMNTFMAPAPKINCSLKYLVND